MISTVRTALAVAIGLAAACTTANDPPVQPTRGMAKPVAAAPAVPAAPSQPAPPHQPAVDAGVPSAPGPSIDAGTAPVPAPAVSYAAAIKAADWAHWPGLPAELREADFMRELGLGRVRTSRRDGRLSRRDVVIVQAPNLRYWVRERQVVLVEVTRGLGSAAPTALRDALGAPEREGAGRLLLDGATTTELVWARRGIALTVAESYDDPPSFPPRLAAVQLFPISDLRTFVLELGGNDTAAPRR